MSTVTEQLVVVFRNEKVGSIWRKQDGRLAFRYSQNWLESASAFGISLSLPLAKDAYVDERPGRFFENLLPEGQIRSLVAGRLGISVDNSFAMLKALGGECAGALAIVPEDKMNMETEHGYLELSENEIQEMASREKIFPVLFDMRKVRLSLAGAQNKLPVLFEGGKFYLPVGTSPSSHILKFHNRDFSHLPENEVFITRLARAVKLEVVETELMPIGNHLECLVRRYDRPRDENEKLFRLHQEDFCQALGFDHSNKYEAEGGPCFADCFRLVSRISMEPLVDTEQLLRWHAFNAFIGNADGHAKNVSLLYAQEHSIRLAPFYDLVCTRAYNKLDRRLAMAVSGVSDPGQIRERDWTRLAEEIGVGKKFLLQLLRELGEEIQTNIPLLAAEFKERHGVANDVGMIVPVMEKQIRRALKQLAV